MANDQSMIDALIALCKLYDDDELKEFNFGTPDEAIRKFLRRRPSRPQLQAALFATLTAIAAHDRRSGRAVGLSGEKKITPRLVARG